MIPSLEKLKVPAFAIVAYALLAMAGPVARADDYCITNGAQAAHGWDTRTWRRAGLPAQALAAHARSVPRPRTPATRWPINQSSRSSGAS